MSVHYDRPVAATLVVKLANGETFEATAADLDKFGYVSRHDAYMAFHDHLANLLIEAGIIERDKHLTETRLNPLRYIAELAITHPAPLTHPEMTKTNARIVEIEKTLREHLAEED